MCSCMHKHTYRQGGLLSKRVFWFFFNLHRNYTNGKAYIIRGKVCPAAYSLLSMQVTTKAVWVPVCGLKYTNTLILWLVKQYFFRDFHKILKDVC